MLLRLQRHSRAALCCVLMLGIGASWPGRPLDAQSAATGKKPLSYDAYDAWWSIQGTTLSRDGEWLLHTRAYYTLNEIPKP